VAGGGGEGGDPAEDGGGDESDAAPARAGQLPFTGLALAPLFALGILLVALGATLHTAVRSSRWPQGPFSGRRYRL
jgi:hypothetical protein